MWSGSRAMERRDRQGEERERGVCTRARYSLPPRARENVTFVNLNAQRPAPAESRARHTPHTAHSHTRRRSDFFN